MEIGHAIEVQAGAGWTEPKWTWAMQCFDRLDKVLVKYTIYFCSDSANMSDT